MLLAHLDTPDTYRHLLTHPVWREAIAWLQQMPEDVTEGIHEIRGESMFVNVQRYETLPREECRFESHRRYVDLQYSIGGGEWIDWMPRSELEDDGAYDVEKDLLFHKPAPAIMTIPMKPRWLSIYFPEDAHRPKVSNGVDPEVRKLVIKIEKKLFENE